MKYTLTVTASQTTEPEGYPIDAPNEGIFDQRETATPTPLPY